ncbi:MAG: single-stranded DNA-binding protein [Eubacteriales bacterium]|nr:single-stranded DNA-binding protein [Eubacteriales bacterium]MDD3882813.1 single-stranded DNA-binding protein [Eubacteriales bacterium]MDD4513289.1 single-stranded DNA-binding protein [Eubacteriales bacterium]
MNKVFLIGNLTRDPELRTTQSGISVCSFGIAVNRRRSSQSADKSQPEVDFFNVTVWRQAGENCAKYLAKGRKVGIVGQVQIRQYDAQDGTKRTAVDVIADDVEFLSPANQQGGDYSQPAPQRSQQPASAPISGGFTPMDDDELPF